MLERHMSAEADIQLSLPALPSSVTIVRQAIGGLADALEWNGDFAADVKLAASEACTNVVVHAYENGPGPLDVHIWFSDDQLRLAIDDKGGGMSPSLAARRPSLGIGLPLMVALCDTFDLAAREDGSTRVQLVFNLDRAGGE